jgi:hypothetical protein
VLTHVVRQLMIQRRLPPRRLVLSANTDHGANHRAPCAALGAANHPAGPANGIVRLLNQMPAHPSSPHRPDQSARTSLSNHLAMRVLE